jgi:hypothetical protein
MDTLCRPRAFVSFAGVFSALPNEARAAVTNAPASRKKAILRVLFPLAIATSPHMPKKAIPAPGKALLAPFVGFTDITTDFH